MVTKQIDFLKVFEQVYEQKKLFGVRRKLPKNPLLKNTSRKNSVAIVGGALGDEGKGRVTDDLTAYFLKKHTSVLHYRDNGGANAGHTVLVDSIKIALHQLGSGVLQPGCTVVLGKEMVLHPEDLVAEIQEVLKATSKKTLPAQLVIDEMALLSLDTHRAFETVLKEKSSGSKGATGRGISPAYADVIYRHPLRMRDLMASDWKERISKHYSLYADWVSGSGFELARCEVVRLAGNKEVVGKLAKFLDRLEVARAVLKPYVGSAFELMEHAWSSNTPMVFEKAQAIGLDIRWGVYPDVTASNCGFDGIYSSTEGIVDHYQIAVKAATIKATYSSSVGSRKLPTVMNKKLADRIREDANEYGSTTKRPRDIVHIDLPMLSYLFRTGGVEYLSLTHLDICYPEVPIKVCVGYTKQGKSAPYRPDQEYLNTVKPVYIELPAWDGSTLGGVTKPEDLPLAAAQYLAFLSTCLNVELFLATTGPKRNQTIRWY